MGTETERTERWTVAMPESQLSEPTLALIKRYFSELQFALSVDLQSLASVRTVDHLKLPKKEGVYIVTDKESSFPVLYVGESVDLHRRWHGHHTYSNHRLENEVRSGKIYFLTEYPVDRKFLECLLAARFAPRTGWHHNGLMMRMWREALKAVEEGCTGFEVADSGLEKPNGQIIRLNCRFCANKWWPRGEQEPKQCPRCKRYEWKDGRAEQEDGSDGKK